MKVNPWFSCSIYFLLGLCTCPDPTVSTLLVILWRSVLLFDETIVYKKHTEMTQGTDKQTKRHTEMTQGSDKLSLSTALHER